MNVKIADSWKKQLHEEFEKSYFNDLVAFVKDEYSKHTIYPAGSKIFSAFEACSLEDLKVVIIGQDPKTPGSHQKKGWEEFTDAVIKRIDQEKENVVFMLWGSYAQKKGSVIDRNKHHVLSSPHPSPFSAHRGFLGNQHFSKCNAFLKNKGMKEIVW